MRLYDLRTEYRENPIGLTAKAPRFSWKMESQEKDTVQTAYEIKVIDENGKLVWNSGKKLSDQSVLIAYEGEALFSETLYTVQVYVQTIMEIQNLLKEHLRREFLIIQNLKRR